MTKDDLISRQAVLDAIVQCTNCGDEDTLREYVLKYSLDNGWTGGILEALDAVKDLPPAQPEPQWIPVSERLPEEAEDTYWVCTDGGYQCQCRWTDDVYGLGSNGEWTWEIFDIPQYSKVLAWMSLPEAYKPNK